MEIFSHKSAFSKPNTNPIRHHRWHSHNPKFSFSAHFFGEDFNPEQVWNQHLQNYIKSNEIEQENTSFQLSSVNKSNLKMRRKRASRSQCPCVKCCSARANGFPSPINHPCIVKGCSKTYTRPAHLRNHLKTHENSETLKCDMCSKAFMKSEMIINHMFDHSSEMKLL